MGLIDSIKRLFGSKKGKEIKEEKEVVKESIQKSTQKRLEPVKKPVLSTSEYNPKAKTIFPIDLNAKDMEALDAICLLSGFEFVNNKWIIGDKSIGRDEVASLSEDVFEFINENSLLTKTTYTPGDKKVDILYDFALSFQNKLLEVLETDKGSTAEIGNIIMVKGNRRMELMITDGLDPVHYNEGDRIALLGPNMQLRYILEVSSTNKDDTGIYADLKGLHVRAVKSRAMHVIRL